MGKTSPKNPDGTEKDDTFREIEKEIERKGLDDEVDEICSRNKYTYVPPRFCARRNLAYKRGEFLRA